MGPPTTLKKKERKFIKLLVRTNTSPVAEVLSKSIFQIKPIILPNSINHIRQNPDTPEKQKYEKQSTKQVDFI